LAHRVKGGAKLIHYEQLILTCENLEAHCAKEVEGTVLVASTAAMRHCMQRLLALLQAHASGQSL